MLKKVHLTPQMAKEILAKNYKNNRRINWAHVSKLSMAIKNGDWNGDISEFNGAICIADDGTLIDGQHRCQAVIYANQSIDTWIQFDVPKEAYQYFDNGLTRRTSDYLNVKNAKSLSCLAARAFCIEHGESGIYVTMQGYIKQSAIQRQHIRVAPSRTEIIEYVQENDDYLQMLFNQAKKISKFFGSPITIAATLFLINYTNNGDMLIEFVDDMGQQVPNSSAVIASRTYIMQKVNDKRFNSDYVWLIGCLLTAYEGFKNNRNVSAKALANGENQLKRYEALMLKERNERRKRS